MQPKKMKPCLQYAAGELRKSKNEDVVFGVRDLPDAYPVFCDPEHVGFMPGQSPEVCIEPSDEN